MRDISEMSNNELIELYQNLKNEEAKYEAMQMALKIILNSLYGAQANQHFRYFSTDIAEGITLTGQLTIQYISKAINEFLNKKLKTENIDFVIANDTDSAYICLDELVKKVVPEDTPVQKIVDFIDKFASSVIEPFISDKFQKLADYVNAVENKMHMKREAICDRAIWRAKKNYVLQVYDNEGIRYTSPKLKTVGIETARSSTPEVIRLALEDCLDIILNKNEEDLHDYVKKFKEKFMSLPVEDISFPRGVSDLEKWAEESEGSLWKVGAPIHVKASITYNEMLKKTGLEKKYPPIKNGDKIKFIYLKQPNPARNNAIAFIDFLFKEFGLDEYIDRELQFEKTFLEPLKSFTSILGWNVEKVNSVFDFFGEEELETHVKKDNIMRVKEVKSEENKSKDNEIESKKIDEVLTSQKKHAKIKRSKNKVTLENFF